MKILNLYAGIGGNRKLWSDENEITAVEFDKDIAAIYKDLYPNDVSIVGIHSEFLQNVTDDNWTTHNIVTKFKEKKLVKDIQGLGNEFEIVIFNSKQPIWSLFENIQFKIILIIFFPFTSWIFD